MIEHTLCLMQTVNHFKYYLSLLILFFSPLGLQLTVLLNAMYHIMY